MSVFIQSVIILSVIILSVVILSDDVSFIALQQKSTTVKV
jgi:hypothetical protein